MSTVQFVFRDEAGDIKRTVHAAENDPLLPVIYELERQITRLQESLRANKPFGETIIDLERQITGLRESIRQHEQQTQQQAAQIKGLTVTLSARRLCEAVAVANDAQVTREINAGIRDYRSKIAKLEGKIRQRDSTIAALESKLTDLVIPADPYPSPPPKRRIPYWHRTARAYST